MIDLMTYEDVQNEVLKLFLDKLAQEYGSILTNVGGTTGIDGDKWISPKAITMLVHELDKEISNSDEYAKLKAKYFA